MKVGQTSKRVERHLKSLNATSVPGNFEVIAIFPSNKPKRDASRVHGKLRKYHLDKEHFDIDPVEGVRQDYRALNRRESIIPNL